MHDFWLISKKAYEALIEAMATIDISAAVARTADEPVTAEPVIENGVMRIPIVGILSKRGASPIMQFLFGQSTDYGTIINALAQAEADPEIKSVSLDPIDSPGGSVNGIFEAVKALREFSKPTTAIIKGQALSGGYMFAAATDKIIVQNPADLIGSVGVVTKIHVSDNEVAITSSNAPFKAPDPKTEAGFKAIQEELDMLHNHMVNGIAEDRDTTADIVNSEFGRGSIFTADIALRRGMIDEIGIKDTAASSAVDDINKDVKGTPQKTLTGGNRKMKLSELLATDAEAKAEHDTAVIAASTTGRELGVTDERKRVTAHLANIGHSAEIATKAIVEGTEFDQPAMSNYMNAGMKQVQGKQRVDDNGKPLNTDDGDDDLGGGKDKEVNAAIDAALEVDESKSGIFA